MFGSNQYIEASVQNFLDCLKKIGEGLAAKNVTPMTSGYLLKIYIKPDIGMDDAAYFHTLIGVLRWIFELGKIDINEKSLILSSHLVLPQDDHFQELLCVFAHLKKHMNTEMVFDLSEPEIDTNSFHRQDWSY